MGWDITQTDSIEDKQLDGGFIRSKTGQVCWSYCLIMTKRSDQEVLRWSRDMGSGLLKAICSRGGS